MEVGQPLKENGLPKMSPTVDSTESSESVTDEVVQQNGTTMVNEDSLPDVTKVVSSVAAAADDDSNEAKGLEDDDAMERLMYSELDDADDEGGLLDCGGLTYRQTGWLAALFSFLDTYRN